MNDFVVVKNIFSFIDDLLLLDIYTGTTNWVMMTNKNMLYSMEEQLYKLISKILEDECTGVYRDNYVGILAIVRVLVHL